MLTFKQILSFYRLRFWGVVLASHGLWVRVKLKNDCQYA